MIKLIRKHQKKVLAFFGIGLMIAFAAQTNTGRGSAGPNKQVLGKTNTAPIYNTDMADARREWGLLSRNVQVMAPNMRTGQYEARPIIYKYFTQPTIAEIEQKPELFLLLRQEAVDANTQINKDELQDIMTNDYVRPAGADEDTDEAVYDAVADLLRIDANFNRVANDVKVSQPQRDLVLAKALQRIQLNVVELAASRYASKVATPTTQAVQEQFEKYGNVDPGKPDAGNPFGFGYRLQDRVKLQYLQIDRQAAEKIVDATKTPYDWDVEARLYYLQHKDEFATTQPTNVPTTEPTATGVRPYEQVRDAALRSVRQPQLEKLILDVQNKILATMQSDLRIWSNSSGATSLGEPYPSYTYLQKLCDAIEAQFKLRVFASEQDRDFLSAVDLAGLKGIGTSEDESSKFSDDVIQRATAYLARSDKDTPAAKAQLMTASDPLFDLDGNVYIYRLTDARAAEPAPDVQAVAAKIESDLRTEAAYRLAQAQAKAILAKHATMLSSALAGSGLTEVGTAPFSDLNPNLGDEISLSSVGQAAFVDRAFHLLAGYDPTSGQNPMEIIEVPQDAKVFVAQLAHVTPSWDETNFYRQASEATDYLLRQEKQLLREQWMSYDQVAKRTGYQAQQSKS
jgi:hypothetical protein